LTFCIALQTYANTLKKIRFIFIKSLFMSKKLFLSFFTLILVFAANITSAQNATLSGVITDQSTGEALISATIKLGETGTVTDFDGTFQIDIAPGDYTVEISYVGYETYTENLTLSEGEQKQFDLALNSQSTLLNTATVTSGKFEKPLGEVTVSLDVLQPNLIENTSKVTLDQALEKIPGVTIIDGQANIRGGSGFSQGAGSRVLLLVDDMPILQADAGFPNWDDVPLENIEQVEIIKGAASALYGSSALNGVINVRTAYAKSEPVTNISTFGTTTFMPEDTSGVWWDSAPMTYGGSISHRRKIGKLDLVVGGYYLNQETHNQDTYKKYGRFNFNTRYRISDRFTVSLAGNMNRGKSGSFFYWGRDSYYTGNRTATSSNVGTRERFRFNLDPVVTYYDKGGNKHKFQGRFAYVDNENFTEIGENQSNQSEVLYGEYQFQKRFSDIDFVMIAGLVGTKTSVNAPLYGGEYDASNLAGYLQLDKKLFDRLNVSAGFRFESNTLTSATEFESCTGMIVPAADQKESKPVFRFGLNYEAAEFTFLRASIGQGYRYPTIAETYICTNAGGFFVSPNPGLQSETGWSGELGIKQGFKVSSFEGFLDISAFILRYQDMIEFNLVGSSFGATFQATNIGSTEIRGYEVSLQGRGDIFGLPTLFLAGYTNVDPTFGEFDTTPAAAGETPTLGQINSNNSSSDDNILKYHSRHMFKFDLETKIKQFSVGLAIQQASNIEAIDAAFLIIVPNLITFREEYTDGYTVLNGRIAYNFSKKVKLSAILNNITNEFYSVRPGLIEAPRNLTARLDVKF
jgi:iron complex outermembrane receptor protein